jgi:hypothetical protein
MLFLQHRTGSLRAYPEFRNKVSWFSKRYRSKDALPIFFMSGLIWVAVRVTRVDAILVRNLDAQNYSASAQL